MFLTLKNNHIGNPMDHSAFKLNQDFLTMLCARIHALRAQYGEDKIFASLFVDNAIFSNNQLATIIDSAHWASQTIEEGKQIKISIVFKNRKPSGNIFHFDTPLPLTSNNLVKIGSALESAFSDICICAGDDGQPQIWSFQGEIYWRITGHSKSRTGIDV